MLIYGNKISLFKVIGIYWGTSIGLSIVYSLTVQTDSKTENETASTEHTNVETKDGQQGGVEETQPKENTYEVVLSEKNGLWRSGMEKNT